MLGRKFYYRFSLFYFVYEGDFQVLAGGLVLGNSVKYKEKQRKTVIKFPSKNKASPINF